MAVKFLWVSREISSYTHSYNCVCAHVCTLTHTSIYDKRSPGSHRHTRVSVRVSRKHWTRRAAASPAPSLQTRVASHVPHTARPSPKSKPYFSFSSSAVPLSGNIEEIASKILSEGNFRGGRLSLSKQGNEKGKKNESEQAHQCFILSTLSNADFSRNYQFCVSLTSNLFYKYLECW